MGKPRIRIVELKAGPKRRKQARTVPLRANKRMTVTERLARINQRQPKAEEVVSALRQLEKKKGTNWQEVNVMERRLAAERQQLIEIAKEIKVQIARGKRLGKNVENLRKASEDAKQSIEMTNTLLEEFIRLWAKHPKTKALVEETRKVA
jgi:hypothetical protein